jgi:hypothetical protein
MKRKFEYECAVDWRKISNWMNKTNYYYGDSILIIHTHQTNLKWNSSYKRTLKRLNKTFLLRTSKLHFGKQKTYGKKIGTLNESQEKNELQKQIKLITTKLNFCAIKGESQNW